MGERWFVALSRRRLIPHIPVHGQDKNTNHCITKPGLNSISHMHWKQQKHNTDMLYSVMVPVIPTSLRIYIWQSFLPRACYASGERTALYVRLLFIETRARSPKFWCNGNVFPNVNRIKNILSFPMVVIFKAIHYVE